MTSVPTPIRRGGAYDGVYGEGVEVGGGPPHDGGMDARLAKLESIIPTLATKVDVEKAAHDVTKWTVGTMVAGIGLFIVIMTFVLNNAIPKAASGPSYTPAPIVIHVPAPAPAPAKQ